jgi:plastocyanin
MTTDVTPVAALRVSTLGDRGLEYHPELVDVRMRARRRLGVWAARAVAIAAVLLAFVAGAACGGVRTTRFTPADLKEPAGATIAVENRDTVPHAFTVNDEKIDVDVDPGEEIDVPLDVPVGSYTFHCTIHPEMHGTLTLS